MLFSYPSSTAVGDRTPGWAGPCSDSTGPLSSPGLGSLLAADNNLITDKVKPLPFKGSPDLWWPWQGTARFRAVPCPRMRQGGGQECLVYVSTCTYTCDSEREEVPNYTVSIFNCKHMLWSFHFQHKHRAEYRFRQTSPAETLHCSLPRQRTRQRVTQGSCLLHPCIHTLHVMAKSSVQGPLRKRVTSVSVFRYNSRASPGSSGRHSALHCCLPLATWISLLNSP